VPRVGEPDGLVARVRAKPWIAVAVTAGVILVAAWLGWAIYVGADQGVSEAIGVLIAWPAIVVAVVLLGLPLFGLYLLIRWLSGGSEPARDEPEEAEVGETG
jgi:hypothetical protein